MINQYHGDQGLGYSGVWNRVKKARRDAESSRCTFMMSSV